MKKSNGKFNEELAQMQAEMENDEKNHEAASAENINKKEEEATEEKESKEMVDMIIDESEGSLTKDMIDEWKSMYFGKIYSMRFEENDSYIFRYISRIEMKKILSIFEKSKTPSDAYLNELIFDKCVLYPDITPDLKITIGAGTIDTVSEQIKIQSNFIPTEIAVRMVQKI